MLTTGYNEVINRRQFGLPDLQLADRLPLPATGPTTTPDGWRRRPRTSSLRHEKGETDDHTVTWQCGRRVLCCGDLFIWASPNARTRRRCSATRGVGRRLAPDVALRPSSCCPATVFPSSAPTVSGRPSPTRPTLLDALVDQTLEVMNGGGRLDDAIHGVRPPADAGMAGRT